MKLKHFLNILFCSLFLLSSLHAEQTPLKVFAGDRSTAYIKADGTLWRMGYNSYSQLGYNHKKRMLLPYPSPLSNEKFTSFSNGGNHSLFIKEDGSLWGSGANSQRQLGTNTQSYYSSDLVLIEPSKVISAATGSYHSLFIKEDGSLWAMGRNSYGQLGDGTTTNRSTPVQIESSGVISVSARQNYSLYIKSDGSLWATGYNGHGQLGDGTTINRSTPVQIESNGVAAVATGLSSSSYIKSDGSLWTMGNNSFGQLGDGTKTRRLNPTQIERNGVAAVAMGNYYTSYIKSDGSLWGMGYNINGQLGPRIDRRSTGPLTPTQIESSGVAAVATGHSHTIYLKDDNTLWAMGNNIYQQFGQSEEDPLTYNTPVQIPTNININTKPQVFMGGRQTISIAQNKLDLNAFIIDDDLPSNNLTYHWQKVSGPGNITFQNATSLQTIATFSTEGDYILRLSVNDGELETTGDLGVTVKAAILEFPSTLDQKIIENLPNKIAALRGSSFYIKADGTLWGMGLNYSGHLATSGNIVREAQQISPEKFLDVKGNSSHSLFLKADGSLWASGDNRYGSLGDNSLWSMAYRFYGSQAKLGRRTPVQIVNSNVTAIATGFVHALYIKTDGSLWSMGSNIYGQLGEPTTTVSHGPTQIQESDVVAVAANNYSSFFIKTDGSLWAVGYNGYGQVRLTPRKVAEGVSSITAGYNNSFFIKTDGSLWAVGSNNYGQLGNGTTTNSYNTIKITENVVAVEAAHGHSLFIKTDGSLWAMGNNQYGQLGDGTTINRSIPVQIKSSGVTAIATGGFHSLFTTSNGDVWAMGYNAWGQLGVKEPRQTSTPIKIKEGLPKPNQAPQINIGSDKTITLTQQLQLSPAVGDDGLPSDALTYSWTKLNGPASVTFSDATTVSPTVNFSTTGQYTLRLTVSDGELNSSADIKIKVQNSLVLESGTASIDHNWKSINFTKTFVDPVVIAGPPSSNDASPAVVRTRNVTATSCEIRLQEWDYLDNSHVSESIDYIVVEKGTHTLETGEIIEVGSFVLENSNESTITLSDRHSSIPVILTSVQTANEADALTTRVNDISASSFKIKLQEQESNPESHLEETVGYIAIEPGSLSIDNNDLFISSQENISNSPSALSSTGYQKILAATQSINEEDTAALRKSGLTGSLLQISLQEEKSLDPEVTHADETIAYILISTPYTVNFTAGENGTITGDESQRLDHGENTTPVTAVPNSNYHFISWSDGNTDNPRTINNVTEDKTLNASFAINTYSVVFTAGDNGTITGNANQTINHAANSSSVTATPNTGYHFVSWSDANTNPTRIITNVTADKTLSATFAINTYTLAFTAGNNGTITGNASQTINHGANSTSVIATPNTGYHFVSWSDANTNPTRTINNVTADKTLSATFAINTYTLAFTAGNNGNITGNASQTINHGANSTSVTATPSTGYHFVSWNDGNTNATRVFTNITADKALSATFAINTYTLAFTAGNNGTITGNANQAINHGANSTAVTATPNSNYHFVSWSDGNTSNPRTINNIIANKALSATFAINTYTLAFTAGNNGTITGSANQTINHGANSSSVTATPNTGYHFVSWSDGNTNATRAFTNVIANKALSATFAINTYTLAFTAGDNGAITGSANQTINHGENSTSITATPNSGYQFEKWSDNNTNNPRTVTNVTANQNLTASFKLIEQTPISGIFFSQAFEHDQLNRRNKVTQLDQSKWSLTYDSKGNLRSALKVDINTNQVYYFQYTYDDIGNRITSNQDGVIVQYTANDLNQYTSIVSNGVTETRQYDADANPLNIRQWDMGWDFENRLTSCNDQASDINVEFAYSFDHMRAWKKVIINGQTAKWIGFVYKGRLLVAEIDLLNDRKPIRTYTWGLDPAGTQQQVGGIGALLSMDSYQTDGSKKHYRFINDASGNVVKVLEMHDDNTITVANSYEYGPFGQVIAKSETVENPFQFQTKYYDKETGFSDYGFRYYDPIDGRWVNRDPIGIDGGINTYNFVSNNPVNPFSGGLSLNGGMQLYSGGLGRGLGVDPWGENFAFEIWDAPGNEGLIYDDAGRAADSIHQTITELVAFLYPLEISRKLVRQFGYKRGPLKLTKQEMIDVVPVTIMDFDANPIDNIDTPFLKMVKEMASKGEKTKKLLNYGITQITFVAGTLGRFTARYTGNLKVTSKDGKLICWEFDGSVSFFDLWDFNTDSATDEAAQSKASEAPRTTTAKKDIALAKKYFRGQPYKITSVSVPIVLSANYYNDKKVSQTSTWPGEKFPKRFRGNRSRFIEPEINTLR